MAYKIRRNKIQLVRGDTLRAKLTLQDKAGNLYIPTADDEIIFTVKRNAMTNQILIQKTVTDGEVVLNPSDTENLEFGAYVYDVQVVLANGNKDTVIQANVFELLPEVTGDG